MPLTLDQIASSTQDILRQLSIQGRVFTASTGSQATAAQTSGVSLFNPAANTRGILVYSIKLMNSSAGQTTLQELRKVTIDPAYSSPITAVNHNLTSALTSGASLTFQASASPTGTVLDQDNTNTNNFMDILTNGKVFWLPPGVASGLIMFPAQGGTGGLWSVTYSYIEY